MREPKDITDEWNEASEYIEGFAKRIDGIARKIATKSFNSQEELEFWISKHPEEAAKQTLRVAPRRSSRTVVRNTDGTIFITSDFIRPFRKRPSKMRKFINYSIATSATLLSIALLFFAYGLLLWVIQGR